MPNCTKLMTAAQTRAMEMAAMAAGEVSAATLMERAGRGVVQAILAAWPELAGPHPDRPWRAVMLCGPGNNGGDGFVIARHLAGRGWQVRVLFEGDRNRLSPEAGAAHDAWQALGPIAPLRPEGLDPQSDLVVDALFGTGLARPLEGFAPLLEALAARPRAQRRVAVDLPSGLCADSGRVLGGLAHPPRADLTVSFQTLKPGHLLAAGPALSGRVVVVDLGLSARVPDDAPQRLTRADLDVAALAKRAGHKYSHGHALVIAGGPGQGGAARLAARAALRIGAGLVTLAPSAAAMPEHAGPPDALMRRAVDDAGQLAALLADRRVSALCLGPGCGIDRAEALLPALLDWGGPAVLDADALSALARRPDLVARLHAGIVLTPHDGEFARLWPEVLAPLAGAALTGPALSRLDAARAAQEATRATVLLKGPDSVIAAPDAARIHSRTDLGWLATAGSGDVLAGLIAGLLARGLPPLPACEAAVLCHSEAAAHHGAGLIADDLPDLLPVILRALPA